MRKVIFLLVMLMSVCLTACSENEADESSSNKDSGKSSIEESKDIEQDESESESEEEEEETKAESSNNSSIANDESNLELVNEDFSGKVTDISTDFGSKLLLLVDNKLYYEDEEVLSFDEKVVSVQSFSTIDFGDMVFAVTEAGTLSCWDNESTFGAELELCFKGLPYNEGEDFVVDMGLGQSYMKVLSVKDSGAYLTGYNILDDRSVEAIGTFPISEYTYWTEDDEMMDAYSSLKDVMALGAPLAMGGYDGYCLTNENELYYISSYYFDASERNDGDNAAVEMKHRVSDVEYAYCSSYVLRTCEPVYSKVGDSEKIYTYVSGESIINPDDNIEIAFILPDGHTPDEVVNIYGDADKVCVFEFSNGDIYYAEAVDDKNAAEYSMTKCEELTELNSQGRIKKICSPFAHNKALVYVLLDDNSVYQMRFE